MRFTQIIAAAAALATNSLAAPNEFLIKSTGSKTATHNNLYIEAYHTGAGLSDAVLATKSTAGHFFLNETHLQLDIGQEFGYGFDMGGAANYAEWEFVTINAGIGNSGFELDGNNKIVWNSTEFGGWLACDWWHGAPQLFWLLSYDENQDKIPSSCSTVNLVPESISS